MDRFGPDNFFSQPPLISFKRDKNIGNFLVRSAFKTSNQAETFKFARARADLDPAPPLPARVGGFFLGHPLPSPPAGGGVFLDHPLAFFLAGGGLFQVG